MTVYPPKTYVGRVEGVCGKTRHKRHIRHGGALSGDGCLEALTAEYYGNEP